MILADVAYLSEGMKWWPTLRAISFRHAIKRLLIVSLD